MPIVSAAQYSQIMMSWRTMPRHKLKKMVKDYEDEIENFDPNNLKKSSEAYVWRGGKDEPIENHVAVKPVTPTPLLGFYMSKMFGDTAYEISGEIRMDKYKRVVTKNGRMPWKIRRKG